MDRIARQVIRDFGTLDLRIGDAVVDDPKNWKVWGPERRIGGKDLARLVTAASPAPQSVLRVIGVHVADDIDLGSAALARPMIFERCKLDRLVLREADTSTICLTGSFIDELDTQDARINGKLRLTDGGVGTGSRDPGARP
jgi:hypothetical protein